MKKLQGSMEEDRISQLPENILHHHILSLLPQKDAVRTCILSKSWRHLGSTRPKFEFEEDSSFPGKKRKFLSVVEKTLQRYVDQKLPIQEFTLRTSSVYDSETISRLRKWILVVLMNKGLKTFNLRARLLSLPSAVFEAESLEELYLEGCELNKTGEVLVALKGLRTLSLRNVGFEEESFEKIMSSCPLIQHLVLDSCWGLSEYFHWYHLHINYFFPSLKSLYLRQVHLPSKWLKNLSSNSCPCLLRTLSLRSVWIEEETFENIMSICPLIQHLVLESCPGLSDIRVNEARNLKHFDCDNFNSIVFDDAPSLETIRIKNWHQNWNDLHINFFFPRLKSLYLSHAHVPTELLNSISSSNCPCLEELELHYCSGFSEFKLSNRSIKRLIFVAPDCPIKAIAIDAANMLYFEYKSKYLPSIFSFATTSREWKSHIELWQPSDLKADVLPTWYLNLYEILKALSQSQISLDTSCLPLTNQDSAFGGISEPPVVVERLCLKARCSSPEVPTLLNCLFRICRPRYIGLSLHSNTPKKEESLLAESVWKTLVNKGEENKGEVSECELPGLLNRLFRIFLPGLLNRLFRIFRPKNTLGEESIQEKNGETGQCDFWQQDLEESSIQVSDKNTNEWHPVQVCALSNNQSIRFGLKWRDLS